MPFYLVRKAIRKVPGTVIKAAPIPKPEITQGFGTREQTGPICRDAGYQSVLLVTDRTLFSLGLHEKVVSSLNECGIQCTLFCDIDSEPTIACSSQHILATEGCRNRTNQVGCSTNACRKRGR